MGTNLDVAQVEASDSEPRGAHAELEPRGHECDRVGEETRQLVESELEHQASDPEDRDHVAGGADDGASGPQPREPDQPRRFFSRVAPDCAS